MDKSCLFVICAAPPARRAVDIAQALVDDGWTVIPVATPSAADGWVDREGIQQVTGVPLSWTFERTSSIADPRTADSVLVCPATFNTVNKLAAGIADNYPLALLAEALGRRLPTVMVPFVNESLWNHPQFEVSLGTLAAAAVRLLGPDGTDGARPTPHGSGDRLSSALPMDRVVGALSELARGHSAEGA